MSGLVGTVLSPTGGGTTATGMPADQIAGIAKDVLGGATSSAATAEGGKASQTVNLKTGGLKISKGVPWWALALIGLGLVAMWWRR